MRVSISNRSATSRDNDIALASLAKLPKTAAPDTAWKKAGSVSANMARNVNQRDRKTLSLIDNYQKKGSVQTTPPTVKIMPVIMDFNK